MPKTPIDKPLNADQEARQIVADLRAEVAHGLAFSRVLARLTADERAFLRRVASEAHRERQALQSGDEWSR